LEIGASKIRACAVKSEDKLLRRRKVITFEELERSRYYLPDAKPSAELCHDCGSVVNWLTPNQAVALTAISLRELFRRIECQSVHFIETPTGLVLICPNSLSTQGDT
jgi:hypothetical protein